jgi:hypothetical protein
MNRPSTNSALRISTGVISGSWSQLTRSRLHYAMVPVKVLSLKFIFAGSGLSKEVVSVYALYLSPEVEIGQLLVVDFVDKRSSERSLLFGI